MKKTAILTAAFPMDDKYVEDYFQSLVNQTDKQFDIILLNDGFEKISNFIPESIKFKTFIIGSAENPVKNREKLLSYALETGYDYVIWADLDDFFSSNRVSSVKKLIDKHDIVVNEIIPFEVDKDINNNKGVISQVLEDKEIISMEKLLHSNVIGLSNSAMALDLIRDGICLPDVIAVDWYLYSCLLYKGAKVVFTNSAFTYYRQYDGNLVGWDSKHLKKCLDVRNRHYYHMSMLSPKFEKLFIENKNLILDLNNKCRKYKVIIPEDALWWEIKWELNNENNQQ